MCPSPFQGQNVKGQGTTGCSFLKCWPLVENGCPNYQIFGGTGFWNHGRFERWNGSCCTQCSAKRVLCNSWNAEYIYVLNLWQSFKYIQLFLGISSYVTSRNIFAWTVPIKYQTQCYNESNVDHGRWKYEFPLHFFRSWSQDIMVEWCDAGHISISLLDHFYLEE